MVNKYFKGSWSSTCPQFVYRKAECKHINSVKINND